MDKTKNFINIALSLLIKVIVFVFYSYIHVTLLLLGSFIMLTGIYLFSVEAFLIILGFELIGLAFLSKE